MRRQLAALALAVVVVVLAACSGNTEAPAASQASGAASPVSAVCNIIGTLRTTEKALASVKPETDSVISMTLAANNVATQAATLGSAAPTELRSAVAALITAIEAVRAAVAQAGQGQAAAAPAITTAIAGVDAAWKQVETQAACPG